MCPAAAPAAFRPCASVAPAASAAAFLAAPGELDADRVVGLLADDARAGEDLGERARELLVAGRGDEAGAVVHHLLRVRRAADAGHAPGAERALRTVGRRQALGRDEALGDRHDGRAPAEAAGAERRDHLAEPARGHGQKHVVGALDARRGGLDAQLRRQLDAGEVHAVLALGVERRRLLGRARLQASCAARRARAGRRAPSRRSRPRSRSRAWRPASAASARARRERPGSQ